VAVLSSSGSYSAGVQLSLLWLSSVPQDYILQVSNWAFCGCPQFLKIIFYRYPTEPFVTVLSSSDSCSTGVQLSILWLSSFPQDHILPESDLAFCGCPQFLRLIFCRCPIEPFVAVLSSSRSYSTGTQLSLLWLSSVPQDHFLQVSNWTFCDCPQFLRLMFYRCPIQSFVGALSSSGSYSTCIQFSPFLAVLNSSGSCSTGVQFSLLCLPSRPEDHILQVSNWAFCGGCTQFLRLMFYRCPIELFVAVLSSSDSYSTGIQPSFLWLSSVPQAHTQLGSDWAFCGCPL